MSNSSLISCATPSPNRSKLKNKTIDTITIHCMAGNMTVESCGAMFADATLKVSSNYGIGSDGRIALYVDEADRSWCTSNAENDSRAVTIEVANCGGAPDWPVSDKALDSLIKLCADICRRNGIKRLLWQGNPKLIGAVERQNMTVHRWFAAKACPGDYLYGKHAEIARKVNKLLGVPDTPEPESERSYRIRATCPPLDIYPGPGSGNIKSGCITDTGVYTVIEEKTGANAEKWGRLKSGAGWITLRHTKRVTD